MALKTILQTKKKEVAVLKQKFPLETLETWALQIKRKPISLRAKLATAKRHPRLICEIKKASPSQGLIRKNFNPVSIAKIFNEAGASAISVLTDKSFFKGSTEYLAQVRKITKLPILRKDFIIDEHQVLESRIIGADCILLIVAAVSEKRLKQLMRLAKRLNLETLVEIHNQRELKIALRAGAQMIGINNRNLKTLKVDVTYAKSLLKQIPNSTIRIVESGVASRSDIDQYGQMKVDAFLVGTSIMKSKSIRKKIEELRGDSRKS